MMDIFYYVVVQMNFINLPQELHFNSTILTWFDERFCLIFRLQEFIGRMTRNKDWYCIETDNFIESSKYHKTPSDRRKKRNEKLQCQNTTISCRQSKSIWKRQETISQFEIYHIAQTFVGKPEPLYSTQYDDFFIFLDGFDMNTGQPKPHSIIDQNFSGKIQFDNSNQKYIFPALNISNNFATIEYNAHQ